MITKEGLSQYGVSINQVQVFETLASTNQEAKRQALMGAKDGTVILANHQSEGRGRLGRSFYSPKDGGIYCSFIVKTSLSVEDTVKITTAASVLTGKAICHIIGEFPQIKWVNDLYLDGKKVCGILAEAVYLPGKVPVVILGIGINCNAVFPEELEEIAGNIPKVDKTRLAAELILKISKLEEVIKTGEFLEEYRKHSMVIGKRITILGEEDSCYLVKDIGNSGELLLMTDTGESRTLSAGEISIRLAD